MVAGGRTSIRHDLPINVGNIAVWADDGRIEDGGPVPSGGGGSGSFASKTTNYLLLVSDSGTTFDNGGSIAEVDFTLPTWVAGLRYIFIVVTGQTLKVIAPAASRIAIAAANSATAGNVVSNTVFSVIELVSPNGASGQWVAKTMVGTWTVN